MEFKIGPTIFFLEEGDITHQETEAIVNAANSRLAGGGGVDGAIHRAGGPAIMEEGRRIGSCPTGQAVITTGGNLKAKYVIHTVGPIYHGGNRGRTTTFGQCLSGKLETGPQKRNPVRSLPFLEHRCLRISIGRGRPYRRQDRSGLYSRKSGFRPGRVCPLWNTILSSL